MAKSALERKQEQLRRKREQLEAAPEISRPYAKEKQFFEYAQDHTAWDGVRMALDTAGFQFDLEDDSNPESATGYIEDPDLFSSHPGSLGKAEIIVTCLLDAAADLALVINDYKKEKIEKAISDLRESTPKSDEERKAQFDQMVLLTKIREQLDRKFRREFPLTEVKEI